MSDTAVEQIQSFEIGTVEQERNDVLGKNLGACIIQSKGLDVAIVDNIANVFPVL